jgi:uncharacterized protein
MVTRELEPLLRRAVATYPVISITGPRQSGKTTLARGVFADFRYVLLEETDTARLANEDPRGFFERFQGSLILDEVQKTPGLLSYLQRIVDERGNQSRYILTGSESLLLTDKISQTLAGRVRCFTLLPFSLSECPQEDLAQAMLQGGYPRIHDSQLVSYEWLGDYYATYIQRDVRSVLNVGNLSQFDRFVRLAAGRVGQLTDYAALGAGCGITQPTAKSWMSVLEATFVVFLLQPHFRNFNKRIIKSPKVYFHDTGLLCYLLRIRDRDQLLSHPLYGSIFENWVISERLKRLLHQGEESNLYFWRDQKGHEVDLIADRGTFLHPTEIKSSMTFHPDFVKNLRYLNQLQSANSRDAPPAGECVYAGSESHSYQGAKITGWNAV